MADQIKVDMIVKALSEGFEGVTSEMGKVEDSFGKVAVAQELANQKNVAYKQGVQQLTQGVKDGTITMEDAAQGAQRLGDELGIGAEKAQKTGTSWTELASKMSVAKEVLGTVAAGFKAVYDIAKEGAAIERTSETFDALSASINGTADSLLGKLQTATGGAVSNLELMSSANRFMAMGLADTEDSAAKLAQTAVTLGQAMGDEAGPSMENFALLLANQSIPRLDSFGISSGVVRERIAELTAGVDGLDKETAFMTAVMEQADATMGKIGQTGGATADNFTRLSVSGQNLTD
ncbi:MAG: hypothetical protein GY927_04740, partial [bacterium]|nr:hypothetical protein [bacterium]